jgi:diguanylate cyclase (GGDEF)-like protein
LAYDLSSAGEAALDPGQGDADRIARLSSRLGLPAERLASLDPDLAALLDDRLAQLQEAAHTDELTGVMRRGAGLAALQRELGRAHRHGDRRLAVAFVDVTSLKSINDSHGHAAGDEVLQELAAALRRRLRAYDLILRWGGDEFVVVLSHTGSESAHRILDEVRNDFEARSGCQFRIGVAEIAAGEDAESLIARADRDYYLRRRRERDGDSTQNRQGREAHSPA